MTTRKYRINWFRVIILALTCVFLYTCFGQQIRINVIQGELDSTNKYINKLKAEKANLQKEQILLKTPDYVEKVAREEMGLVKNGEALFVPQKNNGN